MLADGCSVPSLKEASKVDKHHSERNAHRLFFKYGLALRVPISNLDVPESSGQDMVSIPYLQVTDYLRLLLNHYEEVLVGGLKIEQSVQLCRDFWNRFKSYNKDHLVYDLSEEARSKFIPIMVHGDKGRTLQKSPIFVLSFELPWGLPPELLQRCAYDNKCSAKRQFGDSRLNWTCQHRAKGFGKRSYDEMVFGDCTVGHTGNLKHEAPGNHQRHNSKGHSFLSRFLIAAVPSKVYNKNDKVLPSLLEEVASQLKHLFQEGLRHTRTGSQLKFAFIGAKGDAEWHFEAANFNRSYHRTGLVNHQMICPLCEAGAEGISFSDVSDQPAWLRTVGTTDPWESIPPLNNAPYASRCPAGLYKFDPFHVLKFGVFRDCVGSTVVRLAAMKFFDFEDGESVGIAARLERAYSLYKLWCLAEGKSPTLKNFTKANFNFEKFRHFAWVNAKGSEVTLLMMWLDFFLGSLLKSPKQEADKMLLKAMHQTIHGGLTYTGVTHGHGIWLPRSCSQIQLRGGFAFLRGYAWLAEYCTSQHVSGFRLRPKLHYFHHLLVETREQLSTGSEFSLSSVLWLCESNEDFIGRLSRVSRRVASRTAALRTTQRYLVKVRCLLDRLLPG